MLAVVRIKFLLAMLHHRNIQVQIDPSRECQRRGARMSQLCFQTFLMQPKPRTQEIVWSTILMEWICRNNLSIILWRMDRVHSVQVRYPGDHLGNHKLHNSHQDHKYLEILKVNQKWIRESMLHRSQKYLSIKPKVIGILFPKTDQHPHKLGGRMQSSPSCQRN